MNLDENETRFLLTVLNRDVQINCINNSKCENCKSRSDCQCWSIKKKLKTSLHGKQLFKSRKEHKE